MEVHHHPHVGKKALKEYLTEGLMIFFAVTMGFFAEQLREFIVERKHEVELMHNLVEDLEADRQSLQSLDRWYSNQLIPAGDSIKYLLNHPNTYPNDNSLYVSFRYVVRYLSVNVSITDKTFTQLKNNKGFNIIRDKKISDSIIKYYNNIKIINDLEGYLFLEKQDLRQNVPLLLDGNMYDLVVNERDHVIRPNLALKAKPINETQKNDFLFRLSDINSLSRNILNRIKYLEQESERLSKDIKHYYEFNPQSE
jgi:hypothetical protein